MKQQTTGTRSWRFRVCQVSCCSRLLSSVSFPLAPACHLVQFSYDWVSGVSLDKGDKLLYKIFDCFWRTNWYQSICIFLNNSIRPWSLPLPPVNLQGWLGTSCCYCWTSPPWCPPCSVSGSLCWTAWSWLDCRGLRLEESWSEYWRLRLKVSYLCPW